MADHSLTFTIGSTFSGEGFEKAKQSVQQMDKSMKAGARAANDMASMLGGVDSAAGKAMGAMTGMLNAILSFNVAAIATQAVMIGISMATSRMKEEAEELTQRMNAMKQAVSQAFAESLQSRMSDIKSEVAAIADGFDSLTKQANALTAAFNGLRAAQNNGGVVALEVEKINQLLEAHSDAERETIEATMNLRIAREKASNVEAAGIARMEAAHKAIADSDAKREIIEQQLAKIREERAQLEEVALVARESGEAKWKDIQAKINELKTQEAAIEAQWVENANATNILKLREQQTIVEVNTANEQAALAIKQVELANQKAAEKTFERLIAEREALEAMNTAATQEDKLKAERESAQKESARIQKEVNDSASALKTAQDEYRAALENYNANFAQNTMWEAFNANIGTYNGRSLYTGTDTRGLASAMSQQAIESAIRNREVTSVQSLQRRAYEERRANDEMIRREKAVADREQQRYDRIMSKNSKTVTDKEREFVENFEKVRGAAEAQKRELEEKRANLEAAEARDEQNAENIKAIKEKLEALGLK